jgi:hypothetical protein
MLYIYVRTFLFFAFLYALIVRGQGGHSPRWAAEPEMMMMIIIIIIINTCFSNGFCRCYSVITVISSNFLDIRISEACFIFCFLFICLFIAGLVDDIAAAEAVRR